MGRTSRKQPEPRADTLSDFAAGRQRRILLAVPQNEHFARVVVDSLAAAGWQVRLVYSWDDALDALERLGAALLIVDAALDAAAKLLCEAKLNPATCAVPVLALFPRGSSPLRSAELRVQADIELSEPIDVAHFVAAATREAERAVGAGPPQGRKVRFIFPSRQADLDRAAELAAALLRPSGLDEEAQTSLLLAFREAAANGIQHGNRRDPARCIRAEYRQEPAAVAIEVRDEGPGFDFRHYLDLASHIDAAQAARDRHQQGGQGGLGIVMLLRCADRIEYNEKGNAVTLTKQVHRLAPSPAGAQAGPDEDPEGLISQEDTEP